MKISICKKVVVLGLTFVIAMSMTACGGGKSADVGAVSAMKGYSDVRDVAFSGKEIELTDVEGDFNTFVIKGGKIYFLTEEWTAADPTEDDSGSSGDAEEKVMVESEDKMVNEAADEGADETESKAADEGADETESKAADEGADETESEAADEEADETVNEAGGEMVAETENKAVNETVDEVPGNHITRLYSMNCNGTDITKLYEFSFDINNESVQYPIVDNQGKITLFSVFYDEKNDGRKEFISHLDESGRIVDHQDIRVTLNIGEDAYINKVFSNDNGGYIVVTDNSVFIMDDSNNKVDEIKNDNSGWMSGSAKMPDGKIVCASSGDNNDEGVTVRILDTDNKKFGEKIELGVKDFGESDAMMDGCEEYDFFYKDHTGIYGYSLEDDKTTKIVDYTASEINAGDLQKIVPLNSETLIGSSWNQYGSSMTLYSKADPSEVKEKTTIILGSMWGVGDGIKDAVIEFNKENDKYRIEFVDYSENEDPQTKMNADIAAGNAPDIIDLYNIPIGQYVSKDILEDLTPYFKKDEVVKKEDILPSVEKAMEIDGKLYYISPGFSINTLVASKKDVGDKTGWTFKELKALLEEKGKDVRLFYSENKNDIMSELIFYNINDYIDWSSGKCRFDSDDFKSVLEVANEGTDAEMNYSDDAPGMLDLIHSGKVLLPYGDSGMNPWNVQTYKQIYNSDITFIGYPCEDKRGSYFNFVSTMGIYSKSQIKDGAWEFLRFLMTKDYQVSSGNDWDIPTNKDAFEAYMKKFTATKEYTDDYGNIIIPLGASDGEGESDYKYTPLSSDEEKQYSDLINNTTKVVDFNVDVMNIIKEEAAIYFSGQKSLDDTAGIIQKRVTTYVNENK